MARLSRTLVLESEESMNLATPYDGVPVPEGEPSELDDINETLSGHLDDLCQIQDQACAYSTVLEQFPVGSVVTEREQALLKSFVNLSLAGTGLSTESFKAFREQNYSLGLESAADGFWETLKKVLEKIIEAIKVFWNWLTKANTTMEQSQGNTEKLLESKIEEAKKDPHKIWIGRSSAVDLSNFSENLPKSETATIYANQVIDEFHDSCQKAITCFKAYTDELPSLNEKKLEPQTMAQEVIKHFESIKREGIQGAGGPSADYFFAHVCGRWYVAINRINLESKLVHDTAGVAPGKEMDIKIESGKIEELARSYKAKCDATNKMLQNGKDVSRASVAALEKEVRDGAASLDKVFRETNQHAGDQEERKAAMFHNNIARLTVTLTHAYARMVKNAFDLDKSIHRWLNR